MKYQSLHRGLSKASLLRIPLILFIIFGGTGLGSYLLYPSFLPVDLALLTSLTLSIITALKISQSLKGVPTEYLHFEGTTMHWSIEREGKLHSEQIDLVGLKVKEKHFDYLDIESANGSLLTLHQYWSITENNTSDASFCALILKDDGAVMHGFKTFGKRTSSIGNIEEINTASTENNHRNN